MTHYTDEDLVLYYYGEGRGRDRIEQHLDDCPTCRSAYESLQASLALVRPSPLPERDERYGLEVWQRIRHQLPEREPWLWRRWFVAVAAAAVLTVTAFVAGWLVPHQRQQSGTPAGTTIQQAQRSTDRADERVRVAALGEHLDRSERLLLDIANDGGGDIHDEQQWADELVASNRIYREAALRAGDTSTAAVLDELERQLLDIVHAPAKLTPQEFEQLRTRLDAAALLFKVRVLQDQLRERPDPPAITPRKTT